MLFLKRFFNFYINSSIHVALAICSLLILTCQFFQITIEKHLFYFVFFASISGYNFVKYFGVAKLHHKDITIGLKYIRLLSVLSFVVMCCLLFFLKLKTISLLIILAGVTFLYAFPFLPNKIQGKNLRAISGVKIYIIALVWSLVTVIIPLINVEYSLDFDVWITATQRFLFVLVLTLPFEIRDLKYDNLELATIPQKIGVKYTKVLGVFLLSVCFLLEYFKDVFQAEMLMSFGSICVITALFLFFSNEKQRMYYSSFWVEGIPILWLLISYSTS